MPQPSTDRRAVSTSRAAADARRRACPPKVVLGLLAASLVQGCGHRADPLPPLRRTPPAPSEFRLAQRGDHLELRAAAPSVSVDGLAYERLSLEFLHGGDRIDLEKRGRRVLATATPGAMVVTTLPLPPAGTPVRAAVRAVVGRERGPRSLTFALVSHAPIEAPSQLEGVLDAAGIELRWRGPRPAPIAAAVAPQTPRPFSGQPPPGVTTTTPPAGAAPPAPLPQGEAGTTAGATPPAADSPAEAPAAAPPGAVTVSPDKKPEPRRNGFLVYRRLAEGSYSTPLFDEPTDRHQLTDTAAPIDTRVCYVVSAVGSPDPLIESAFSNEVCLARRDVTPPGAPAGLAALPRPGAVELLWSPSPEEDLAQYRVYRGEDGGEAKRLAEVAFTTANWLDETVEPGRIYTYTLTAVDQAGNESARSVATQASLP